MSVRGWGSLLCVGLAFGACVGDSNGDGGDAAVDATADVAQDTSPADVANEATADAGTTYATTIADQSRWEHFDIASVAGANPGFAGGAFDGRYVYFSPSVTTNCCNSELVRFDTEGGFTSVNSWDGFDLASLGVGGFAAAIFVAPYLYLVPYRNPGFEGRLVRYDTSKTFKDVASYEVMDLATLDAKSVGFGGGAFDGKYLYMTSDRGGNATRYDTSAPFDAGASYENVFISANYVYYAGIYDGARVYMAPYQVLAPSAPLGLLQAYDTTQPFSNPSSFASYDMLAEGGVDGNAGAFIGALFDGRYVYFEPYGIGGTGSTVVRYDPQAPLADPNSYSKLDLAAVDANAHGFQGCTFDGRYAYFAPTVTSTTVRLDTTATFGDKSAWQSYDLTSSQTTSAHGYVGAVFDGKYVYYVPYSTTLAVRFDAKSPSSLPSFRSSFF